MSDYFKQYLISGLLVSLLFTLSAKTMAQTKNKIGRITLAVFEERKMKLFYEKVFEIEFKTTKHPDFNLHIGDWGGIELQLCPAIIAKNTAIQNRHQFHINVQEIDSVLKDVKNYGGSVMENVVINAEEKVASITDPDSNTIVLVEKIKDGKKPIAVGIGGIFFKSENPEKLKEWYEDNLGIPKGKYGLNFSWGKENGTGYTLWSPFKEDTEYFKPSDQEYMINFRVNNLDDLLKKLKENKVQIIGKTETYKYGKFAWILDLEGNKIELWEPNDNVYKNIIENVVKSN